MSFSRTRKADGPGLSPYWLESRERIDEAFGKAGLPKQLEWSEEVTAGRWVIRYLVDLNYHDPDKAKMLELNRASAQMKRVFGPYIKGLSPQLEDSPS